MPVIVVGADTPAGTRIIEALITPGREVRAFVSDESSAVGLRDKGVKVALGDVSDDGHVEGAATGCFSAVLVAEAAFDHRERSFADTPEAVMEGWARAVNLARVTRTIWLSESLPPRVSTREVALVGPSDTDFVERVVALDDAQAV